jgi:cell division protein FtsL
MKNSTGLSRSGNTLLWVACVLLLTAELFVFTWSRVQCRSTAYELTRKQDEHNRLLSLEKKLRIERAHLMAPDRISALASRNLGLQMPEQNQIMTIR